MSWTPVSLGDAAIVVFTVLCTFRAFSGPWPGWPGFRRRFLLGFLLPVCVFAAAVFSSTWAITGRMPPIWSLSAG